MRASTRDSSWFRSVTTQASSGPAARFLGAGATTARSKRSADGANRRTAPAPVSAAQSTPDQSDSAWIRPRASAGGTRATTLPVAGSIRSSEPRAVPTQSACRSATTASGPSGTGTRPVTRRLRGSTRSSIPSGRAPYLSAQQVTQTLSPCTATPTGPYSTWPRRIWPLTRLAARSTRQSRSDRSPGTHTESDDNARPPGSAVEVPTRTLATTWLVEVSIRCRPRSVTTHSPAPSRTSCRGFPGTETRATTGDGGRATAGPAAGVTGRPAAQMPTSTAAATTTAPATRTRPDWRTAPP